VLIKGPKSKKPKKNMEQNKTKPAQNQNQEQNPTTKESLIEGQPADSKKKNSFQEKMKKKMRNKNTPEAYVPEKSATDYTSEQPNQNQQLQSNPQPQSKLLQELSQPQAPMPVLPPPPQQMVYGIPQQVFAMPIFVPAQTQMHPQYMMHPIGIFPPNVAPAMTELPPSDQVSYEFMLNQLIAGGQNVAPNVYNQTNPGEGEQQNIEAPPKLQEWMQDLEEEELHQIAEMLNEQEFINQEFMGNGSYQHTYSDLREDDSNEDAMGDEEYDEAENPQLWLDPEGNKRREEARKNIFNGLFKDCECCKGYVSNCNNPLCKNLGICHCVARKQNEEANEPEEKIFIEEFQSCTCCKGFVLSCEGAECQARMSCVCQK
jgi:hypothetical protein